MKKENILKIEKFINLINEINKICMLGNELELNEILGENCNWILNKNEIKKYLINLEIFEFEVKEIFNNIYN